MLPQPPKKKLPSYTANSVIESLRDMGSGVSKTIARDVVGRVSSDVLTSLFGYNTASESEVDQSQKAYSHEIGPEPFSVRPETKIASMSAHDEAMIKQKLEAVRLELRSLSTTIKKFHQEVIQAVEEIPVHPGIYHLNFLDRLQGIIRILRQQVEDGSNWLSLWTGRKQKKQYWGMYKKHGTKFGLSSERTLATQAG